MKRLLLLGGGHAHVEVLRELALERPAGWAVTLVTPYDRHLYSGMVPGHIAGHYALDECAIDLAGLAARAGAELVLGSATLIDPARREVMLAEGVARNYDVLSINIGARAALGGVSGVERHAIAIRPLPEALRGWERVRGRASDGKVRSLTLVGGGAAGVECALAMDHRLKSERGADAPHVRVVTDAPHILGELGSGARARLARIAAQRGIGVHCGSPVVEVGEGYVRVQAGLEFASDATFWSTGAAAPEMLREAGFATDDRGYLLIDDFLKSVSHPQVFAAGDCATQQGRERPKAGVFAVRAAPRLAANLRAAMAGGALEPHRTSPRYLALVSAGPRYAVGTWSGLSWEGAWAWRWKDRIDRRFVARYAASA